MALRVEGSSEHRMIVNPNVEDESVQNQQVTDKTQKSQIKNGSVFAGNLNLPESSIEQKKKEAKRQAWKLIQDTWTSEQKIDDSVAERKSHYEEMKEQMGEYQSEWNRLNRSKADLKETYGVLDDSEEQKDLELLEKRQDYQMGNTSLKFSEEEKERLEFLDESGTTEYQQRALEYSAAAHVYQEYVEQTKKQMADDVSDMRAIMIERLKSHPMVDASKNAEEVLAAASKEIVGMIVEEGKDKIEEKQEEEEEKAEEQEKKQEKKEEQIENMQEKIAIQKAFIEGTKEATQEAKRKVERNHQSGPDMDKMLDMSTSYENKADVKQGLDEIKNRMNLLEADLKGIKVDQEV